jgi:outer membrane translocation and assembly module TamA
VRAASVIACLLAGCHPQVAPPVPGHTDIAVSEVTIEPRAGEQLTVEYEPLIETLGLRHGSAIFPARTFNEFRLAEDRRRIVAYLQARGYFDAVADEPTLQFAADGKRVAVVWKVHEGAPYRIGSLTVVGAPREYEAELRELIPFSAGDKIDLDTYRPLRRTLAERLQDHGYGHARGYSRVFVDREAKTVAWYYYLDPGPHTRIGAVHVEGERHVTSEAILERAHLVPGATYSTQEKRRAELALLDTGAFASAVVVSSADIQTGPPEYPDTGGALAPEQVDANGDLVPRKLAGAISLRIVVVEAPAKQARGEVGVEGDPTRIDTYAGTRLTLRNALGVQHHLVLEGNVGYGWIVDDGRDPAHGVYGSAKIEYEHPGWLARDLDLRIGARWRDVLYPAALLREFRFGPGVRRTIGPGMFFDVDLDYRIGITRNLPPLDAMTRASVDLPDDDRSLEPELSAQLVVDRRDDRIEATEGWLVTARTAAAPGSALGDDRWISVGADLRAYARLGGAWSAGARLAGAAVVLTGDRGLPFGPRLFGGGAFGMRGFGRDRLSPLACADTGMTTCDAIEVGGKSLVESSVELRWLPYRKFYGAAAFVDAGGAGTKLDPTDDGVSAAFGLGGRGRLWYVPIALDLSYRALDRGEWRAPSGLDRWLLLFRIGEAF